MSAGSLENRNRDSALAREGTKTLAALFGTGTTKLPCRGPLSCRGCLPTVYLGSNSPGRLCDCHAFHTPPVAMGNNPTQPRS